jgi:cellobiose epimerase
MRSRVPLKANWEDLMKLHRTRRVVLACLALISVSPARRVAAQVASRKPSQWAAEFSHDLRQDILKFWIDHAIDRQYGGMLGWLDREGRPVPPGTKSLVQQSRVVWTFAAAYERYPDPLYRQMATHALTFLREKMWDAKNGGFYWLVQRDGSVADPKKHLYGQSFAIYSLAEYARAFGDSAARQEALDLFQLIDRKAHDNANGGYFEAFSQDWKPTVRNDLALSLPDRKSMNTHIHLLESFTTLYRVSDDAQVRTRVEELFNICLERIVDTRRGYLRLYFTNDWKPAEQSEISSYGHDIELSWLLTETAAALGAAKDPKVKQATLALVQHTLRDGFDHQHGGVYYEGPVAGPAKVRRLSWWVEAETLVGLLNAYQLTRKPEYWQRFEQQAQYVFHHFVDHQYGEWFADIEPDGKITGQKTFDWKGPYHQSRACLEVIRRLEEIR